MTDTFFFILSKIIWTLINPGTVMVLLLVCCVLLFWCRAKKAAAVLLHIIVAFAVLITLLPAGNWLLYPIEKRFSRPAVLPDEIDGIIVLAGAENLVLSRVHNQVELGDGAERILAFMHLARQYPKAKLIFTGGSGGLIDQQDKSTDVAKRLLSEQGFDIKKIMFEPESRNTYESAVFTRRMADPGPGEKWILVTSASHMPRSVGIFRKIGWKVIPYTVDHQTCSETLFKITLNFGGNLNRLSYAMRAWTGLFAYYFTGKTCCLLPGPDDIR